VIENNQKEIRFIFIFLEKAQCLIGDPRAGPGSGARQAAALRNL
jgi:hypothetical protein